MALEIPCECGKKFNVRVPDHIAEITKKMNCPGCGAELNGTANRLLAASRRAAQLVEAPLFEAAAPAGPMDAEEVPSPALAATAASPFAVAAPKNDMDFAVAIGKPKRSGLSAMLDDDDKKKLSTGEQIWCGLPLVLIGVGGAIGGLCGGVAYAVNQAIFKQTKNPIRYVLSAFVTVAAGVVWFMMAMAIGSAINR